MNYGNEIAPQVGTDKSTVVTMKLLLSLVSIVILTYNYAHYLDEAI